MSAPGALSVGRPVTPTTGSNQLAVPRSGQLLGWWAAATSAITLTDAVSVAAVGAGTQLLTTASCPAGWNPFPVDFVNGLVVNTSAAITLVFA